MSAQAVNKKAVSAEGRKRMPVIVDGNLLLTFLKTLEAVLDKKPGIVLWSSGGEEKQRFEIAVPPSVADLKIVSQACRSEEGYDYLELVVDAPETWDGVLMTARLHTGSEAEI